MTLIYYRGYLLQTPFSCSASKTTPLRPDVTRKAVHQAYLSYCETHKPDEKVMGYSTFRHFMKEQFPYIRFKQLELPGGKYRIFLNILLLLNPF